jgi:hypothetical protein
MSYSRDLLPAFACGYCKRNLATQRTYPLKGTFCSLEIIEVIAIGVFDACWSSDKKLFCHGWGELLRCLKFLIFDGLNIYKYIVSFTHFFSVV